MQGGPSFDVCKSVIDGSPLPRSTMSIVMENSHRICIIIRNNASNLLEADNILLRVEGALCIGYVTSAQATI